MLVAFAASALLLVLQTVVFQLLPWDSSASAKVAVALRVGFVLADVTVLVSLVTLARAEPRSRGFLAVGALLAAFAVLSGLLGLAASALGSDARILHALGRATSGAEPVVSIATTLLATLALGALAHAHGSRATAQANHMTIAVVVSVALSLGFKVVRLVGSGPRSLPTAWASWGIEVARPALVALLALSVARAIGRAAEVVAVPVGPYRAAGEGAPSAPTKEPLDAATVASLGRVADGLSTYRSAFLIRGGAAVATTLLGLVAATMRHNDSGAILMSAIPLASLATAVLLARGLFKLLALPRGVRARGVTFGAIVALGLAALVDAATLLAALAALFSASSYRAARDMSEAVMVGWPVVALAGGASLLFVASALRRVGEKLGDDRVVARARWVQGLAIGAGAAQIGALYAGLSLSAARYDSSSDAGGLVVAALALASLGAMVAVVVLHVLLVSAARSAVLAEVLEAPRAG